ncbi:DUF5819 family protein [Streptomyces sp. Act-28]
MTGNIRIQRAALLAGAALLGAHFALAAFSQTPLSPAKVKLAAPVNEYLHPYFSQNWMLFAPDPLAADQGVIARGRCEDGEVTPYRDVTGPFIKQAQDSRFFPSRMSRIVSNGIQQYNATDELMRRLRSQEKTEAETQRDESEEAKGDLLPLTPFEKRTRAQAVQFLSRFAWTQMPQACGNGQSPEEVQVRMYIRTLPPWSERDNPRAKDDLELFDFPWKKAADLQ